eukprot:12418458-Karenia_brevis.AAC.2
MVQVFSPEPSLSGGCVASRQNSRQTALNRAVSRQNLSARRLPGIFRAGFVAPRQNLRRDLV